MSRHLLIIDLSNLVFICGSRFEKKSERVDDIEAVLLQSVKEYIKKLMQQLKATHILLACDSTQQYWREECYPLYKAHREETVLKQLVKQVLSRLKIDHGQHCVELAGCEADDVIYVAATSLRGKMTIVSTDRDFIQLISHRVRLYNPISQDYRYPEEEPEFLLFEKCFRGDRGDNIPSAYPKISKKALRAAYKDENKLAHLLKADHPKVGTVKIQYELNRQLIDLNKIPSEHQLRIRTALHMLS